MMTKMRLLDDDDVEEDRVPSWLASSEQLPVYQNWESGELLRCGR